MCRETFAAPVCACHSVHGLQGYLAHKKQPPPLGPPKDPRHSPTVGRRGVFLVKEVPLLGGGAKRFLMSELPLQRHFDSRGTLLNRKPQPLGLYSRLMPRALWLSEGLGAF